MPKLRTFILMIFLLGSINLSAQQTVGLFQNTAESFNGYTLFSAFLGNTTYLIDNCGELVHSWESAHAPGMSVYLLENGNLLRTGNINSTYFFGGGKGGIVEILDWDGNLVWEYFISSPTELQHHDIEPLPNGNILAIVWDSYTAAEASAAGRSISGDFLWAEKIIEIEPDLQNGGGTIVWEWKAWDHLVQDENPTAENYGVVAESPQLIDLNYVKEDFTKEDWLHFNSIDYNAELDQIVVIPRSFSEIWVIDHSTTTEEASGHTGGNAGKGGDLIYRWGNPMTYDQGDIDDRTLYFPHDAYWIEEGYADEGMIMIFNNQTGEPHGQDYSTIDVFDPPMDNDGNYIYSGGAYGPEEYHWTYQAPTPTDFFSTNISGSKRMPNGNTLICQGRGGRFFEVTYEGDIVWEYICPVQGDGNIIPQYSPADENNVFRAERYTPDYPGFAGQTLTPQGYIEPGSTFECELFVVSVDEVAAEDLSLPKAYPNPASTSIAIEASVVINTVSVYSLTGQLMLELSPYDKEFKIDVSQFPGGIYFLRAITSENNAVSTKFVVER